MPDMTPEQKERLVKATAEMTSMNKRLLSSLDEAERLIKIMRSDATEGCHPRYHGHLRQHIDQLHDHCVEMNAFHRWI